MHKIFYLLLVSFFVTAPSAWGACYEVNSGTNQYFQQNICSSTDSYYNCQKGSYSITLGCSICGSGTIENAVSGSYYCTNFRANYLRCSYYSHSDMAHVSYTVCDTKTEVDSVDCALTGGIIVEGECVQGDTTSCETYKSQCEAGGGTFSGTELANGGCAAHCSLCESDLFKKKIKAFATSCCAQDLIPPDSSENQICWDIVGGGEGAGMSESQSCLSDNSCICGFPSDENGEFNILEYNSKCGAYGENTDGEGEGTSSGGGGSSSSGASEDSSEVPMVQIMGLEGLMDSLHKIIYNTAEVDTTTQFMLMCLQNPELYCPSLIDTSITEGDTIIIEGDTIIINIPSDSVLLNEISKNVQSQGARTRTKLDSMENALIDSMKASDSVQRAFETEANKYRDSLIGIVGATQVVEGNETQALLDSVVGRLDGVLNELAGFGNDSAGQDTFVLDLPDTTLDLGGTDTATIKGTIDSLGEWVSSIVSPDSTGGWGNQNPDGSYGDGTGYGFGITASDNEQAIGQVGGFIRGQLDTGAISNVLDTLGSWHGKFDFGVAASTGGCPSALTKTYSVTIAGATFEIGGVGQYLCTPISGINTTMWDIGRLLLRAVVSIMCFLWLFKVCTSEGKED